MSGHGPGHCKYCNRELIDKERYCYFCEQDNSKKVDHYENPKCFIATSVYGPLAYETQFLRNYRDEKLKHSFFGVLFIKIYYFISPSIAFIISKNKFLQQGMRKILDSIIYKIQKK